MSDKMTIDLDVFGFVEDIIMSNLHSTLIVIVDKIGKIGRHTQILQLLSQLKEFVCGISTEGTIFCLGTRLNHNKLFLASLGDQKESSSKKYPVVDCRSVGFPTQSTSE